MIKSILRFLGLIPNNPTSVFYNPISDQIVYVRPYKGHAYLKVLETASFTTRSPVKINRYLRGCEYLGTLQGDDWKGVKL